MLWGGTMKRFADRLAALEALEAAQDQSPIAWIGRLDREELRCAAVEAVQSAGIRLDRNGAHMGLCGDWLDDRCTPEQLAHRDTMRALCAEINRQLFDQGYGVIPLWHDQVPELRSGLASGDWSIDPARSSDFMLSRVCRRSNGEVWNTEVGGPLTLIGRGLASWGAERGEVLTAEAVLNWIEEIPDEQTVE